MRAEKKKIPFGGRLLIYISVMITLLFAGLGFLWHYLSCYEASRIEGALDRYMTECLTDELAYAMDVYSFEHKTDYQSKKDISTVLEEKLGSDRWGYRRINSKSTDDRIVYAINCGRVKVGEVVVTPVETGPVNLGFHGWEVSKGMFDLAQFGDTVNVIAPYGCEVLVNGIAIGENEVTDTLGLYPQLENYETLITQPNQLMVYSLHPVFEEIAVEFSAGYVKEVDTESATIYAMPVCDDALAEEMIEYCKSFVKAYVEYTANKNALWAVQQFIVPDCKLYEEMNMASVGIKWGHGVNARITALDVKNFRYFGNAISCEASYTMTRSDGDRSETMKILLVETVLGWRVVHREIT